MYYSCIPFNPELWRHCKINLKCLLKPTYNRMLLHAAPVVILLNPSQVVVAASKFTILLANLLVAPTREFIQYVLKNMSNNKKSNN